MTPRANTSKEAVALREAAIDFGKHAADVPSDPYDRDGAHRNRALLAAAIRYADAARRA